jgi:hypothetical protein
MRQRGRKSAAQLATLSVNGDPPRLKPPADLADDEQFLFSEIVTACGPRHFVQSDLPLLVTYVQATLLSRRAVANVGEDAAALALWEKTTGHTWSATRGHAGSHRHRIHRMGWSRQAGSSASMRLNPTG